MWSDIAVVTPHLAVSSKKSCYIVSAVAGGSVDLGTWLEIFAGGWKAADPSVVAGKLAFRRCIVESRWCSFDGFLRLSIY